MIDLSELPGLVATVVTSGSIDESFAECLSNMRSWCDRNDFHNVEWRTFRSPFVEMGRDEVLAHALENDYAWVLQIDADAAPFKEDSLERILRTAFVDRPDSDVVGAYAQLKHAPYLPTIDTGTGTWEVHYPDEGILPVIRTGAHFLLVKPPILRRFGPPWFRTRATLRPIDALSEVDNYARIKEDGINALTETETWRHLMKEARKEGGGGTSAVGEDSGFCDAVKAAGGMIYVDTNIWVGHIGKRVIEPGMLHDAMETRERRLKASVGVYE